MIEIAACDVRFLEERVRKRGARFRFLREESGAAALEFALVSIPFLGLLLIIVETGLVFLFGLSIDDTTQKIARLVQTGQLQQSHVNSAGQLRSQYLCPPSGTGLLPSLIPCSRIILDVRTTKSFGSADTSNGFYRGSGGLRFCAGDARSIVVVRMAFAMPVFLPVLAVVSNGVFGQDTAGLVDDFPSFPGWNHLISSAFVVQNEPFSGSESSTSCS